VSSSVLDRRPAGRAPKLRWWREVVYILAFYAVYTAIRDTQGVTSTANAAFHHAQSVIRIERDLFVYHERAVQHAFIHLRVFVQFWDVYYGTAHFVVTAVALIWLFRRDPVRYPLWRNTLALTTALALIGFAFYPLMPPRLLPSPFGFVDTLRRFGGSWSFDSGAMQKVSNQYAAMPSLHFGWSLWCACVIVPACRRRWTRALAIAYPAVTVFAIVVTANHYVMDAAGGAVVFGGGYLLARAMTPWLTEKVQRGWLS
jgi:hypothetical protein